MGLITNTSRPLDFSLVAFEDDICLAFARKNLLRGGSVEVACRKIDFTESAPIFSRDPALFLLRKAILSLSVTYFGNQHGEDRLISKGYGQYSEVLNLLNAALAVPERQTTNTTLLTALTCMLLELFLPTGPVNFLRHQRGIETIMRLRGPPTETKGETATIFHGLRIVSIVSALADSRPSIYAEDEWMEAPVAETDESGILRHKIFAVLARCTRLMSERDAFFAHGMDFEYHSSLIARVDSAAADLNALFPLWERFNEHQLRMTENMSHMAREFGIANHPSATVYMLYNTARLCIIQIGDSLSPSPRNVELCNDAALKIAKSLQLKGHEMQANVVESNTISFVATKIAWQALGRFETPEGQELARVVKSAVNSLYKSPWDNLSAVGSPSPRSEEMAFMQFDVTH
jgi:hypothetical protein